MAASACSGRWRIAPVAAKIRTFPSVLRRDDDRHRVVRKHGLADLRDAVEHVADVRRARQSGEQRVELRGALLERGAALLRIREPRSEQAEGETIGDASDRRAIVDAEPARRRRRVDYCDRESAGASGNAQRRGCRPKGSVSGTGPSSIASTIETPSHGTDCFRISAAWRSSSAGLAADVVDGRRPSTASSLVSRSSLLSGVSASDANDPVQARTWDRRSTAVPLLNSLEAYILAARTVDARLSAPTVQCPDRANPKGSVARSGYPIPSYLHR